MWAISRSGCFDAQAEIKIDELSEKIRKYRELISNISSNLGEILKQATELHDYLIKPIEAYLDKKKYLCIVPDKTLNYLPFATLYSSASRKWFLNEYRFGLSPSCTIFIKCSDSARIKQEQNDERLLSVGNPSFDKALFPNLREMASSSSEARRIATCYSSSVILTERQATERRVRDEMAKSSVINFATHYVVDERSPMNSRLLLATDPGSTSNNASSADVLQTREIYEMELPLTRLVVLSACQTGIEHLYQGEGAIGFARPFLVLNVPLVVASLWAVDTDATADLMIKFHAYRKCDNRPTAEALSRAQLDMLNGPNKLYRHPYYWAPFSVIGGYATF